MLANYSNSPRYSLFLANKIPLYLRVFIFNASLYANLGVGGTIPSHILDDRPK